MLENIGYFCVHAAVQHGKVNMRSLITGSSALNSKEIMNRPATCPETTEMLHITPMGVTEASLVLGSGHKSIIRIYKSRMEV